MDYSLNSMDFRGFPKIHRYSRDCIVTEKIDGTNAQIVITPHGKFLTGSRNRWITPEDDNHGFSRWAHEHKDELMGLGVGQHFGEWWGSGIQRGYGLPKGERRFSLFNTTMWGDNLLRPKCCHVVPLIIVGLMGRIVIDELMEMLELKGSLASPGFMNPEGIVIYHTHSGVSFKKTFEKDEEGKGR